MYSICPTYIRIAIGQTYTTCCYRTDIHCINIAMYLHIVICISIQECMCVCFVSVGQRVFTWSEWYVCINPKCMHVVKCHIYGEYTHV